MPLISSMRETVCLAILIMHLQAISSRGKVSWAGLVGLGLERGRTGRYQTLRYQTAYKTLATQHQAARSAQKSLTEAERCRAWCRPSSG
jgi:hypothetical protein